MNKDDHIEAIWDWYEKSKKKTVQADYVDLSSLKNSPKWDIKIVEPFGRCLVAKEDIKEGEILFVDHPILTGPKQNCEPLCLGCYKKLENVNAYKCSKCRWPLCGPECETKGYHPLECEVYSKSGVDPLAEETSDEDAFIYESILALRCALVMDKDLEKSKTLRVMESHDDLRKGSELWWVEQKNTCNFLREKLKLEKSDEELHRICGILDVNCHEVRSNMPDSQSEIRVRGIYPLCAMMSHDCSSNTHHTYMPDMVMLVVASKNIKRGQQIAGTYTYLLSGTIERRKHLKYGKFFDCVCSRCSDPTELGTYFSALRCSKRDCDGNIIPINPLQTDNKSDFACDKCDFQLRCGIVNKITNLIYMELAQAPQNDPLELEVIFKKYQNMLHPNHFHLIGIKHNLSQMYGRVRGFLMEEMSTSQMTRKIECCRDLLEVIDRIDSGISRLRGLTLYEYHAPLVYQANDAFKKKNITKNNFIEALENCQKLLANSIRCLQFEQPSTFEGQICTIARDSLKELTTWTETVRQLTDSHFLEEEVVRDGLEDLTLEGLLKQVEEC